MSYYAWMGPITDDTSAIDGVAISIAANKWQKTVLDAWTTSGTQFTALGFIPAPTWPRGAMHQAQKESMVGYINIVPLRSASLIFSLHRAMRRMIAKYGKPRVLFTYNAPIPHLAVAQLARRSGIAWVPIIADVPDVKLSYLVHEMGVAHADGAIFLSWHSFIASRIKKKLHFEGIVRKPVASLPEPRMPAILFTGTLNRYGGVELALDAFARVRTPDVQLWICGKGDARIVELHARRDKRIKFFGVVTDNKIEELSRHALAFINPRPPHLAANARNFPSKLLEYLAFAKPIISTWTNGIPPHYRAVLRVVEPNPAAIAREVELLLATTADELAQESERIGSFVAEHLSTEGQIARLNRWATQLCP